MAAHAIEALLRRTARFQHGVLSYAQAFACGLTKSQIEYRLKVGGFTRPVAGVLVISGTPETFARAVWIAICWAGEGAALSFGAAARQHGFEGFSDSGVEISITRHKPSRGAPFKVHRVSRHLLAEICELDGIPVTTARRTILDLAGKRHKRVTRVLHEAFRRKLVDAASMWLYLEQEFQRGRRGIAILRAELKKLTGTEHLTKTYMESLFMTKLAESKLPFPTPQFPVTLPSQQAFFDFAYPDLMLAIELDSRAWHDGLVASDDAKRQTEAEILGWTFMRFTWGQILYEWEFVEGTIRHWLKLKTQPT